MNDTKQVLNDLPGTLNNSPYRKNTIIKIPRNYVINFFVQEDMNFQSGYFNSYKKLSLHILRCFFDLFRHLYHCCRFYVNLK